jgi:methylthioribose-1-phosphate isomerase
MLINGTPRQTIWLHPENPAIVQALDQRSLPHQLTILDMHTYQDAAESIRNMSVRGAPLIGITAAYGYYLGTLAATSENAHNLLNTVFQTLLDTRPTAVNLQWALEAMRKAVAAENDIEGKRHVALVTANCLLEEDIAMCYHIGVNGMPIIEAISQAKHGAPVNILTHCNAGWLACVDWGTATSAIYQAHAAGIPLHVWVSETRPRNQGAALTAYELGQEGIPHTLVADNACGHLLQHGLVDMVITGADRVTANGDAANKIGTYLKALAARDNNIPFYIAIPASSIDWNMTNGLTEIPIEQRSGNEVKYVQGLHEGEIKEVLVCPENTPAANYGFDVTPARLITGIITERGVAAASREGLSRLYQA